MKRIIIFVLLILFIIIAIFKLLSPNSKLPLQSPENRLRSLKSYSCNIELRVLNKAGTLKYHMRQYYCGGIGYRVELGEERVFIFKDDKIYVEDKISKQKYTQKGSFNTAFKYTFLVDMLKTTFDNAQFKNSGDYITATALIPSNNRNLARVELFIEKASARPKYLHVYNWQDQRTIEIEYLTFDTKNIEKSSAHWLMDTEAWQVHFQQ